MTTTTFTLSEGDCAIVIPKDGEPSMAIPAHKKDEHVGNNVLAAMHLYMQLADGVDALAAAFEKQTSEVPVQ